ncbi:MAG: thioredoxin domain-containing protein [Polyangiaceae bacterium]|nr:thioredoxin domain-containing protein [Polyangiaceae bacterium]
MTNKRETDEAEQRGTATGEQREDSEAEGDPPASLASEPRAPKRSRRTDGEQPPGKKKRSKPSGHAARRAATDGPRAVSASPEPDTSQAGGRQVLFLALVTLALGLVVGWFAHDAKASSHSPDVAGTPAPSGSATAGRACEQWSGAVCKEAGDSSEACSQAHAGAELMPEGACQLALQSLPTTLAKVKSSRSTCDELVTKLCADIGPETESCKLVKEKTPSLPATQCQQMMDSYADVLGEFQTVEKRNAPLTAEVAAAQAAGNGPSFGPRNAKVTVVEYSDFECPYCSRAAEVVEQLKKKYSDRVRFVFRQFPLPMHRNAALASQAALAAHAQGKFWQLRDKMFANQRALDRENIEGHARQIGLDMARFRKALDDSSYDAAVKADVALGEQISVSGTPTMIVNTKRVPNPTDYAAIAMLIDGELAAAK